MNAAIDANSFPLESQALGSLRYAAKTDPTQSMRVVAQQFESLFLNILMKSMRSTSQGGIFDNDQSRMYTELMDQQFAQKIAAGKGLGIADMLLAQMKRNAPAADAPSPSGPLPLKKEPQPIAFKQSGAAIPLKSRLPGSDMIPLSPTSSRPVAPTVAPTPTPVSTPKEFVSTLWPHAVDAARDLGVAPHALVAQAALESGWGKRDIKMPDGTPSYNVFGIKAGPDWTGKTVETTTTEYVNGTPQARVARFRAYDSYGQAFQDYANLLKNSPRYAAVLQTGDGQQFATALQRAGYATDPLYGAKLARVMSSGVMRQALSA
jgi:flagellar protein FlgJ